MQALGVRALELARLLVICWSGRGVRVDRASGRADRARATGRGGLRRVRQPGYKSRSLFVRLAV